MQKRHQTESGSTQFGKPEKCQARHELPSINLKLLLPTQRNSFETGLLLRYFGVYSNIGHIGFCSFSFCCCWSPLGPHNCSTLLTAVTLVVDFMLLLFAFQFYGSSLRQKLLGSSWVDENNTVAALYAVCSSVKYFWYFFISATTFPLDFPEKRLGTWTDHIYSIRPF